MNARTTSRVQRLSATLAALFLVLALLPPPAYVQGPPPSGATAPSPTTPAAGTDAAITGPNCSDPPTGQKAKLYDESEIAIACRSDHQKQLENIWLDNSGQNLVWGGNWFASTDALTNITWPAITTADLNGDGKSEPVMACRDKQKQIAVTTPGGALWYHAGIAITGDNVEWVDVAAGNLDRSTNGDDEVVVAFTDNDHDISLLGLNGNSAGNIEQSPSAVWGWYGDDTEGRGYVRYVAVATGDLNGDGYDDEIVTAFQDGNDDLQCLILRREASN